MSKQAELYIAPGSTLALGSRGYEIDWEFDSNADGLELMRIEFDEDPASGCSYRVTIRHPVRDASPLLVLELKGADGQSGFRIGGSTALASEKLLADLLGDSWVWDPAFKTLRSFAEDAKSGKSGWRFIADASIRTTPPTAQPVLCLHSPKREVLANFGASGSQAWHQLLPIPSAAADSIVRATTDLALVLDLPLTSTMISIWNAGFSRPRILTFQSASFVERLTNISKHLEFAVFRVKSEAELPA